MGCLRAVVRLSSLSVGAGARGRRSRPTRSGYPGRRRPCESRWPGPSRPREPSYAPSVGRAAGAPRLSEGGAREWERNAYKYCRRPERPGSPSTSASVDGGARLRCGPAGPDPGLDPSDPLPPSPPRAARPVAGLHVPAARAGGPANRLRALSGRVPRPVTRLGQSRPARTPAPPATGPRPRPGREPRCRGEGARVSARVSASTSPESEIRRGAVRPHPRPLPRPRPAESSRGS